MRRPDPPAASIHPVQREALWLLLGGGLDDAGKEKWLAWRIAEGTPWSASSLTRSVAT